MKQALTIEERDSRKGSIARSFTSQAKWGSFIFFQLIEDNDVHNSLERGIPDSALLSKGGVR